MKRQKCKKLKMWENINQQPTMNTFSVTPKNLSEYESAVDAMVAKAKAIMTLLDGPWKLFFSIDTESAGVNVRSVGFGIFLIRTGTPSTAYLVGGVNVDIFPHGVTRPEDCEAADRAAVDGQRTMEDFWSKRMKLYHDMNANSIPIPDAVKCINMLRDKFVAIDKDLHIILTARPLAYDFMVLQRLYDMNGTLNPFPSLGWYAFCMGTAIAFRTGNDAYSYNNFNAYLKKIGKDELDHIAMLDGIHQFEAYWYFLCEHHGPDAYAPLQ